MEYQMEVKVLMMGVAERLKAHSDEYHKMAEELEKEEPGSQAAIHRMMASTLLLEIATCITGELAGR